MTNISQPPTILEAIKSNLGTMRPSEKKVARALMSEYPVAGLESISQLSKRANVSAPTVLRFLNCLDIDSYPTFQRRLLDELQQRVQSPLSMYESQQVSEEPDGLLKSASDIFVENIKTTFTGQLAGEFQDAVKLLADPKKRLSCVGGRFSNVLSHYMHLHLQQIRKDNLHIEPSKEAHAEYLLDAGKKDVLLVFDFRRYAIDTIAFAQEASKRGVSVVLVTDPYLSPVSDVASVVLTTVIYAPSPFDSYMSAVAVVETLVAGLIQELDETARKRISKLEENRLALGVTQGD